eukprot:5526382-Amphidinium_carterae.2
MYPQKAGMLRRPKISAPEVPPMYFKIHQRPYEKGLGQTACVLAVSETKWIESCSANQQCNNNRGQRISKSDCTLDGDSESTTRQQDNNENIRNNKDNTS